jgi:hypothetical protein
VDCPLFEAMGTTHFALN